ncbi:MAG: ribonuclease HII [Patescibacteria group bacterium]
MKNIRFSQYMVIPTFKIERELSALGYNVIVGVDEAGCGSLAGPVVAGAVVLSLDSSIEGLCDSKLISASKREKVYFQICDKAVAWSAGQASVEEIEKIGIRQSGLLAMKRAVGGISGVDFILVDAWTIPEIDIPQRGVVKGDRYIKSIAAGSIVAKVTRDRIMCQYATIYPEYLFEIHMGYATQKHRDLLKQHGPCPIHRKTYSTIAQYY